MDAERVSDRFFQYCWLRLKNERLDLRNSMDEIEISAMGISTPKKVEDDKHEFDIL